MNDSVTAVASAKPALPDWVEETDTRYGLVRFPRNDVVLGAAVKAYGEWFEAEVNIFRAFVKPGDTVADVGANFGMHTLALASLVGEGGKVIAIEPQIDLAELLSANRPDSRVTIYTAFAGEKSSEVWAALPNYQEPGSFGSYNMGQYVRAKQERGTASIPQICLDQLRWIYPSFLKIDVEGNELNVLRGAERLIARDRPVLYIENDRPAGSPPLVEFLMERGYRLFWHLAPFFNPTNYRNNLEIVPIHRLGYAHMHGQFWLNGVALMMVALPKERPELAEKLPPGLIEVGKVNEHPCHDERSIKLAAQLAGLSRDLSCLGDDRQSSPLTESTQLAQRARKLAFEGNFDAAKDLFRSALELAHDNIDVWSHMGVLQGPGRYDATIACYERALALALRPGSGATKPLISDLYQNLGTNLMRAERYDEVEVHYQTVKELEPEKPASLYHNWGLLDYNLNRPHDAVKKLEYAQSLDLDNKWITSDLAHAICKTGDIARGFKVFEVRWSLGETFPKSPVWNIGELWTGGPIEGKTLLLHHEQGNGDTFQFIRYVPQIRWASRATHVIFAGRREQKKLLAAANDLRIDDFIVWDDAADLLRAQKICDYHCPLVSAVGRIKPSYESIPFAEGYLKAPYKSKVDFHHGGAKLAVGLVWSPALEVDRGLQRVVPLGQYMTLAGLSGVRLWSLQVGLRTPDAPRFGCDIIISDATVYIENNDWADTAAIIDGLDAVVTVDTAVAHLAGALGKPTFMLNPYVGCWRWCNGSKPWYRSMEMFNQEKPGTDWRRPIAEIRQQLQYLLEGKGAENG